MSYGVAAGVRSSGLQRSAPREPSAEWEPCKECCGVRALKAESPLCWQPPGSCQPGLSGAPRVLTSDGTRVRAGAAPAPPQLLQQLEPPCGPGGAPRAVPRPLCARAVPPPRCSSCPALVSTQHVCSRDPGFGPHSCSWERLREVCLHR